MKYLQHCLLLLLIFKVCQCKYGYVTWSGGKGEIGITEYYADIPEVHVARATYSNEINTTGWAFLELHTSPDSSDEQQAYAAGYLEGYLTRDLIWMHWQNMLKGYCYNKTDICALIEDYVDKNEAYICSMVEKNPKDPYWYQMKLYHVQLEGLAVGYNEATRDSYQWLTYRDILWINMLGDLDELALALSAPREASGGDLFPEHCTGLVKLLPDLTNLYTAQVTWNSYQSMLRFQKLYVLHLRLAPDSGRLVPGHRMSMSSYPGFIQVLEYARAMVANRLARDAREWTDIFRRHNSGTYNNQWYVVDYNKFRPATPTKKGVVKEGLLWVVEQLPGYTEAADLTDVLVRQSYFPSYNIPYFPRVFNLSGGNVRVQTYGDWFAYATNPRAKIIRREQAKIHNLRDMYYTMRYNDFKHDPLSRCEQCSPPYSACNAIAARNDLNPTNGSYPFRALGHRSHGATDAKVTSAFLRAGLRFLAVASPAHNISRGIPPFRWSEFDMGPQISHVGHPDLWLFAPMVHRWEWV